MKVRLGWLFGEVSALVSGSGQEAFLNRCASMGLVLWRMERTEAQTLRIRAAGRELDRLARAAEESGCALSQIRRRGLPFFLKSFRRRYALLAGGLLKYTAAN